MDGILLLELRLSTSLCTPPSSLSYSRLSFANSLLRGEDSSTSRSSGTFAREVTTDVEVFEIEPVFLLIRTSNSCSLRASIMLSAYVLENIIPVFTLLACFNCELVPCTTTDDDLSQRSLVGFILLKSSTLWTPAIAVVAALFELPFA